MYYFFPYFCCYLIATFKNLNSHAYYLIRAVIYYHCEDDVEVKYLFDSDIKTHFFAVKPTEPAMETHWAVY